MRDVFICDAVRTPIGRYGGALAKVRTDDLAAAPINALIARNAKADWSRSTKCSSAAPIRPARTTATSRAWRCCSPGFRTASPASPSTGCAPRASMRSAMRRAPSAPARWTSPIAGGVESMTRAPFVMGKATSRLRATPRSTTPRIGWRFVNPLMKAQYGIDSMPETGENVAEQYKVARKDQDAFALRSQQRAGARGERRLRRGDRRRSRRRAARAGRSWSTATSIRAPTRRSRSSPSSSRSFRKPGTVTAGNASGVNDGAAAMIVASEEACKRARPDAARARRRQGGRPACRRASWASGRCRRRASCWTAGLTLDEIDVIELNEAFASQVARLPARARRSPTMPRTSIRTAARSHSAIRSA